MLIGAYVVGVVVGLLLAWLVVGVAMTSDGERKPGAAIVGFGVFAAVLVAVQALVVPKIELRRTLEKIEREALADPLIAAIKTYDPTQYYLLINGVKSRISSGASPRQLASFVSESGFNLFKEKVPVSSDAAAHGFMSAFAELLTQMHSREPQACFEYLTGGRNGAVGDLEKAAGATAFNGLKISLIEVVKTASLSPQAVPGEAEVKPQRDAAVAELVRLYGRDVTMLLAARSPGGVSSAGLWDTKPDPVRVCQMTAALFRLAVREPPEVSGKLVRVLAQGSVVK